MNLHLILYYHNLYNNNMSNTDSYNLNTINEDSDHIYDIFSEWDNESENSNITQLEEIDNTDINIFETEETEETDETDETDEIQFVNESSSDESSNDESSSDESSSDDNNDFQSGDIEDNNKCINYALCKNNIYENNTSYCRFCYLYINSKLSFQSTNNNKNVCPLCLSNDSSDIIIKLFTCDHTLCYNCIYKIYWCDNNINNIIKIPYPNLYKQWHNYITSVESRKLKCFVIYKLINNDYTDFNEIYNQLIKKINIRRIPKIFQHKLKELVFYQSQYEMFKNNDSYNKYIMRDSIRICPYCRSDKN